MALVGSDSNASNTATSQWFINLNNNTSILDYTNKNTIQVQDQGGSYSYLDSNEQLFKTNISYDFITNILPNVTPLYTNNPPFTVFAQVLGNGMTTVDNIAARSITNLGAPFSELPLISTNTVNPLAFTNLVHISRVATLPYFALSSDNTAYTTAISGSILRVDYVGGTNPPAAPVTISVFANDTNGLSTNTSFQIWHLTNQARSIIYPTNNNQNYSSNGFDMAFYPYSSDGTPLPVSGISWTGPALFQGYTNGYNHFAITGTGTITFTYIQPSNFFYKGATNTTSFVISKAPQTISFSEFTNPVVYSTNPYTITNLPVSSSKLPVTLSIASYSPARWKITNSQLSFSGAGTVTLVAAQFGNSNYLTATPVTNQLTVTPASQTITFPQISNQNIPVTSPVRLKASASSGLGISYRIVSGSGVITNNAAVVVTGHGTIKVAADQLGDGNYTPANSVTNNFEAKLAQTLSPLATIPSKTYTNPLASFSVKVPTTSSQSPTATNVVLTATGPATVSNTLSNGIVTITGAGTVTLTATQAGDQWYFPASVSTSFIVAKAPQKISPFTTVSTKTNGMSPFSVAIPTINTTNLVTVTASGAGYISGTNGSNVLIALTNAGTVTLTANQAGNSNYLAASAVTQTFSVAKGNQGIVFGVTNQPLGNLVFLSAHSTNSYGSPTGLPITYSVTTPKTIGYLTNSSQIQTLGQGTITVVASQAGSSGYNAAKSVTNSFSVKITP
jgi:cyclophilin family peptidyl-prolyl cis-trans isomerase